MKLIMNIILPEILLWKRETNKEELPIKCICFQTLEIQTLSINPL